MSLNKETQIYEILLSNVAEAVMLFKFIEESATRRTVVTSWGVVRVTLDAIKILFTLIFY